MPKLLSMFHRNVSKKSAFPQKIMSLFNSFGKSANSLAFCQKKLDRAVKTAFCLSIGLFWGKRFLRKNFGLLSNSDFELIFSTFCQLFFSGFQSCILCFHQNVSNKKTSLIEKFVSFFNVFGYWVNNFWPSAINISLDLSKLASTCPKVQSEAKKTLFENCSIFETSSYLGQDFIFSLNYFRPGCQSSTSCFCWSIARKTKTFSEKSLLYLFWTLVKGLLISNRNKIVGLSEMQFSYP